jgi:hypothetical protein
MVVLMGGGGGIPCFVDSGSPAIVHCMVCGYVTGSVLLFCDMITYISDYTPCYQGPGGTSGFRICRFLSTPSPQTTPPPLQRLVERPCSTDGL